MWFFSMISMLKMVNLGRGKCKKGKAQIALLSVGSVFSYFSIQERDLITVVAVILLKKI